MRTQQEIVTVDFVPGQVSLRQMFVGTFDHFEAETTAAVIVKILADNGNVWRSANCHELADGFKHLTEKPGPWRNWFNNPFVKIDMHDLVNRGFAEWDGMVRVFGFATIVDRLGPPE